MKRIVLTSAIILGLAAPAFARSQLEAAVGVEADTYTVSELVQLKFTQDENGSDGNNIIFGNTVRMSTKSVGTSWFDNLPKEDRDDR